MAESKVVLNLTALEGLPGAVDRNFEVLTRAIVSRRYGALGPIRETRQQPGVEFFLVVKHSGELGDPGRVWGWSCKWLRLGPKHTLANGQRNQIEDSITKAITHVDGLTDLVICLPERPAKNEEQWINSLGSDRGVTTTLWAPENFEARLAGLDDLRSTFFGELVLLPDMLAKAHERCTGPVRTRWVPPLHTFNHAEARLDRALMRSSAFDDLEQRTQAIASRVAALRAALGDIDDDAARARAEQVAEDLDGFVTDLRAITGAGRSLRPLLAREWIRDQQPPSTTPKQLRALVLDLRKGHLPAALWASGLRAEIRHVLRWLHDADADAHAPLVVVIAAAGMGKTHLAAQLTGPTAQPTAGVFLLGSRLRTGYTLDNLARHLRGVKVDRFDDLLLALDSAGARAGVRIPVIIDGLNEAERPSEWRGLLDELVPALSDYPNVLGIVTLREALASHALPESALAITLDWRPAEVDKLMTAYFHHYLIDSADAWLPRTIFHNPLFLRMYCEAANPLRQQPVGVEALPTSLIGVFERYRDGIIDRFAYRDTAHQPIPADQVKRRLAALARALWTRRVRRLPSDDARTLLDAGQSNWDESLFRRLEEEGVLFRDEVDGSDDTETGVSFDRFGGYLVADDLLTTMPLAELDEHLADLDLWSSLLGDNAHPLGDDVAVSLVGLVPRRFSGHHLWRHAPHEQRAWTLAQELDAESEYLNEATIDALAALLTDQNTTLPNPRSYPVRHAFDRLWEVVATPAHRLNARFLDRVLRSLPLPARDRKWSEWVRHRAAELLVPDLHDTISRWTEDLARGDTDALRALGVGWLLTSTDRELRDLATKALQRYGRPEPQRLFDLVTMFLDVDDPYVVERVVGAAFGAATCHQMPDPGGPFEQSLRGWLAVLRDRILTEASTATSHELLRSYVRATFEFAGTLHPDAVPAGVDPFGLVFAVVEEVSCLNDDDPRTEECGQTFGMDFENYVIGSAIDGRRNYDFDHSEFRRARSEVLARVWELGWRSAAFAELDRRITDDRSQPSRIRANVERYGKKYGWIAYYELIGRLEDRGEQRDRWVGGSRNVTPDIDLTFPAEPPIVSLALPEWAPSGPVDNSAWLRTGVVGVPEQLWAPQEVQGVASGWLLAEGFLEHRHSGRAVFGFFRTLLLMPDDVDTALEIIDGRAYLGNDFFPSLPTVRGVFVGEVPWSPRFQLPTDDDELARPALRQEWNDEGVAVTQVAVELATGEGSSPAALDRSYDVPSFEFAAQFGLRQVPGTLDLVALDGTRAAVILRADPPWTGHLLFVRRDLLREFAGERRVLQVAWGEREVSVERSVVPTWMQTIQQDYGHIWRNRRLIAD